LAAAQASAERRQLVLASASPRRLELLRQAGLAPDLVVAAGLEEGAAKSELPGALARRLAEAKAEAVAKRHAEAFVLGADTVVAVGRRALPKPSDEAEAKRCLELLSGRRHRVLTAIAVVTPEGARRSRLVSTAVAFKRLDKAEIAWYLATEEWRGKAGGYAVQGRASRFVRWLAGSYSNVVGLPIFETVQLLGGLGFAVRRPSGPASEESPPDDR
jgi:septum formation protein